MKYGNCPHCGGSNPERVISNILKENGVDFYPQHTFEDCKGYKNKLPFDFYIPKFNLIIEYQGEFHYKQIKKSRDLKRRKEIDDIKKSYCVLNHYNFLEINYKQFDNIEEIIIKSLSL